jgi:hypothetical protein
MTETTETTGLPHVDEQLDALAVVDTPRPRARHTDPPTSHAAARAASRGLTLAQLAVLDCFRASTIASVLIHDELIARYGARAARTIKCEWYPDLTDSSIRTRCKELVTLGYVRHVDDAGVNDRGRKCARWACTPDGGVVDVDALRARVSR